MSAITVNDKSYRTVEEYVYDMRTTRKDVAEKMIKFADEHRESFVKEMF